MAGEAVSLHSLLANRNCKIYRQNFEADDFPSGAVDLFKGGRANSRGFLLLLRLPDKPSTAGKRSCYPSRKSSLEVGGRRKVESPGHQQGFFPQNWGETEPNRSVTCMVLKAKSNDKRKNLALCSDELREPYSDVIVDKVA
ncbi:hypothetical protein TNCV_3113751 [Trichonephila clavipes]|nr:hypothetical protein TNCV_3113751 [Trichonephila clavipes]